MLYADYAGNVPKSAEWLAKIMIVTAFEATEPHRVRGEDGDHGSAGIEPDPPDFSTRYQHGTPDVQTNNSVLVFVQWGGYTAAVPTLDTDVHESKKEMAFRVSRSSARRCSRDWCYYRRLSYDFVSFCFLFYISLSWFLSFLLFVLVPVVSLPYSCCIARASVV